MMLLVDYLWILHWIAVGYNLRVICILYKDKAMLDFLRLSSKILMCIPVVLLFCFFFMPRETAEWWASYPVACLALTVGWRAGKLLGFDYDKEY